MNGFHKVSTKLNMRVTSETFEKMFVWKLRHAVTTMIANEATLQQVKQGSK